MPLHLRKFSPIDREYPIFEVLDGETPLFDISRADDGREELALHEGGAGKVIALDEFLSIVAEARSRLAAEEGDR
jgi:hypothetical protein